MIEIGVVALLLSFLQDPLVPEAAGPVTAISE
jgi:hypothetical protein